MAIALTGILLGEVAILVDLSNRLFGSYARTTRGALVRISFVVTSCIALALPIYPFVIHPESKSVRLWVSAFGILGGLLFLHFLFPFRHGIRRRRQLNSMGTTRGLTKGVILREQCIKLPALPPQCDRLDVLVLSDLHCSDTSKLRVIQDSLAGLSHTQHDLVFLLGDFGENASLLPEVFAALGTVPSRFGTYCVRGNHDCQQGRQNLISELAAANGIGLLSNDAIRLDEIDTLVIGLETPWIRSACPTGPDASFVIALTHTPDNIVLFDELHVDLGFAGHTHGGKFRLPIIGPLLVPSWYGRFLNFGWFRFGDSLMYVTSGFGYFPGVLGSKGEVFQLSITGEDSDVAQ